MAGDLTDLTAFVAVVRSSGFREASRTTGSSASSLSEAVRRLETRLGVRLLNRSTRSVAPTEAGARLFERLALALTEVEASLDVVNNFRDRPAGTLRLNVPVSAARLVLPRIVPAFLAAYPDICLDVIAEDSFVDMLAAGCDAGIRYDERLERDMVAIPIGPRTQRFATAASPAYLDAHGRPDHPRELLHHVCLRGRFASGAMTPWEFEREGTVVKVEPTGPLIVGQRRHPALRGLAASASRQRRIGSRNGTLVAALLRTVSLLSEPSSAPRAAASVHRFHPLVPSMNRTRRRSSGSRCCANTPSFRANS
jgi:DNA-binding transcriptional LysR family regulator